MPRRLRHLSGPEVVSRRGAVGFVQVGGRGSHAKLRRVVEGRRQTLTVPLHRELDTGTLRAICRQSLRFVSETELRPHFFSED